jgi:molybdopterin-guanine dinucleotide biosynthesis protein A
MGGAPKGLLAAPDTGEGLAERLVRLCRTAIPTSEVVLVGDAARYGALGLLALADDPGGRGPLGGLHALLTEGVQTERDVIALACDLPYMTTQLVTHLGMYEPHAQAVAPRIGGFWQPLFARYDAALCRPIAARLLDSERRALHDVLDALGDRALVLPLQDDELGLLDDWDAPGDIRA